MTKKEIISKIDWSTAHTLEDLNKKISLNSKYCEILNCLRLTREERKIRDRLTDSLMADKAKRASLYKSGCSSSSYSSPKGFPNIRYKGNNPAIVTHNEGDPLSREERELLKEREACHALNDAKQYRVVKKDRTLLIKFIAMFILLGYPVAAGVIHLFTHPIFCFLLSFDTKGICPPNHICIGVGASSWLECTLDFAFSSAVFMGMTYGVGVYIGALLFFPVMKIIDLFCCDMIDDYSRVEDMNKSITKGVAGGFVVSHFINRRKK